MLQEAIEAALDVNAHLIAELGGEVPEEYHGGVLKLGQLGVLPADRAAALAPSATAEPAGKLLLHEIIGEYSAPQTS
jgi:uncharacterized protein YutE (UPF0331/DUF86 family)